MDSELTFFFLGSGGALAGELLKLYELKGKLNSVKYLTLARSPLFWAVTLGMLLASGFVAWAVNSGSPAAPIQVVLTGIGAQNILRRSAEANAANRAANLGTSPSHTVAVSDLFR